MRAFYLACGIFGAAAGAYWCASALGASAVESIRFGVGFGLTVAGVAVCAAAIAVIFRDGGP